MACLADVENDSLFETSARGKLGNFPSCPRFPTCSKRVSARKVRWNPGLSSSVHASKFRILQVLYLPLLRKHPGSVGVFFHSGTRVAGGKVMNAATDNNDRYSGEPPISSMTKNYLEAAVEIAQEAGKILLEELSRPLDIAYKGDEVDIVTQADKRSERFIVERLTKYFPEHAIAAEEGTGHESASASEFRWHVDPLDGTTNFAHGYPCFCVSIALAQRDTLLAAAVFNPYYHELFSAAKGEGATFNGKKIHVSKNATLSTSLLCTGFPVRNRKDTPNLQYYGDFTQHSHGVRRDGSAALDLASVAAGRFDGFWEFGLAKWDVAAGILLIEEAGGKVSDFAGNPYQLGGPVILATNGLIHEEMRAMAMEISRQSPPPLKP
jgi:myo-inositol-1(or 4)-monophosphatase